MNSFDVCKHKLSFSSTVHAKLFRCWHFTWAYVLVSTTVTLPPFICFDVLECCPTHLLRGTWVEYHQTHPLRGTWVEHRPTYLLRGTRVSSNTSSAIQSSSHSISYKLVDMDCKENCHALTCSSCHLVIMQAALVSSHRTGVRDGYAQVGTSVTLQHDFFKSSEVLLSFLFLSSDIVRHPVCLHLSPAGIRISLNLGKT